MYVYVYTYICTYINILHLSDVNETKVGINVHMYIYIQQKKDLKAHQYMAFLLPLLFGEELREI